MKKATWVSIGFLLFIFGFVSLVLQLVGLKLSFLAWIDGVGTVFGFVVRVLMIVIGIVIVYLTTTNWQEQEE